MALDFEKGEFMLDIDSNFGLKSNFCFFHIVKGGLKSIYYTNMTIDKLSIKKWFSFNIGSLKDP